MRNSFAIFGGVAGAVAGYLATLLALELGGFGGRRRA
jgi:NhaP-type Na+/H+ or K+/H+ antiporter